MQNICKQYYFLSLNTQSKHKRCLIYDSTKTKILLAISKSVMSKCFPLRNFGMDWRKGELEWGSVFIKVNHHTLQSQNKYLDLE